MNPVPPCERTPSARGRGAGPLAVLAAVAGLCAPSAATAQQLADGAQLFQQRCSGCHSMEAGQNRVGPHLSGLVGRTAGSVDGARYSAAMRDSAIVWDSHTLDGFLAAPGEVVPGTTMTVAVPDPAQRAAIIDLLQSR